MQAKDIETRAGVILSEAARALVQEAAAFRLAGLLLERPRPGWREDVSGLAREVHDPALEAAAALAEGGNEAAYLALLGPGGAVSPRHAAHIGVEDPGRRLNRLLELYEAFGYAPRAAEDPPDHIAVEAGFVGFLSLKAAHAEAGADREALALALDARRHFVSEHLGPLGRGVQDGLRALPGAPRYLLLTLASLEQRGEAAAGA